MAHSPEDASSILSPSVETTADNSSRALSDATDPPTGDPAPDGALIDDIVIIPDPEPASKVSFLLWALPVVPWLWYLVRSLFASMDLVAIGLPIIAIVSAIAAVTLGVLRRSVPLLVSAASIGIFLYISVFLPFSSTNGSPPTESIRVATVNMGLYWFSDNDLGFLVFDEAPDLVVGVELTESHDAELSARFENSVTDVISLERQQANEIQLQPEGESFRRNGLPSVGVYSNLELTQLDDPLAGVVPGGLPGFRIRVATASGDMVLYALHIPRPINRDGVYEVSPAEHLEIAQAVADAVAAETLPTMVLGDLNTVDRGQAYRALTENLSDGVRHAGDAAPTTDRDLFETLLFARLDHLLMTSDLCTANADSLDTRFSDHRPLLADIGPCA